MEKQNPARSLALAESFGVLSTISVDLAGYPFGSVTPYCMDRMCRPTIYISPIAQHTKNIVADSRVSLTVIERTESGDVQAQGRVTCIANASEVPTDDHGVRERYFRYFPSARQYEGTHAFEFFRLELVRVRFIGGFGRIFWMKPEEFMMANPFSPVEEEKIIQHMNEDHSDVVRRSLGGAAAEMVGIDAEGFDVLGDNGKVRIAFASPVKTLDEARRAFIDLARSLP